MQALTEEKSVDSEDNFYEELEHVFDHLPKYHIIILLGEFNKKKWGERTFSNRQLGKRLFHHKKASC